MNKLEDLDNLIAEVLNLKTKNIEVVVEKLEASKAIPAVPYPKLQLTNKWGQDAKEGFDVSLFKLAGLSSEGDLSARLTKLYNLVDCRPSCPTEVKEIIARLSIMEMFSSVMKEYTESSKGFLFESFMALVLKGSNVEGTVIQDIEIMTGDESDATKRVSLKLLKADSPIKGSLVNLYKSVIEEGQPVTYIVGYKLKNGSAVEIKYFTIDKEFWETEDLGKGYTLNKFFNNYVAAKKAGSPDAKSQFFISNTKVHILSKNNIVGMVPIYTTEQLRTKATELTEKLNTPVMEIYESLNLFTQLLTSYYVEGDQNAAQGAIKAFARLQSAVRQERSLQGNEEK